MKLQTVLALAAVLAGASISQAQQVMADRVNKNGVRWTFDRYEQVGQYANGDWWVVGPVTIKKITPKYAFDPHAEGGPWHKNGTHINPNPNLAVQGLDNSMYDLLPGGSRGLYYSQETNIADNLPVTVPAGTSVVTAISRDTPNGSGGSTLKPQLKRVEVLTVVANTPLDGDFRPCYAGAGPKTSPANLSDVDFSRLTNLPRPAGMEAPVWSQVADLVDGVWYEAPGEVDPYIMRHSRPIEVMPNYGRDVQSQYYRALLHVMLEGTVVDKQATAISLVQIGLDRDLIAQLDPAEYDGELKQLHGGHYSGNAGQGCGAKFSIYFASWLLNDFAMYASALPAPDQGSTLVGQRPSMGWQEDDQVFIVENGNLGQCGYGFPGSNGYIPNGTPEWGIKHFKQIREVGVPFSDDPHWIASEEGTIAGCSLLPPCNPPPCTKNIAYRTCCTANVWWMGNLFSRVIADEFGLPADLYRPEFYHYAERYYTEMNLNTPTRVEFLSMNPSTLFWRNEFKLVWDEYNSAYPIPPLP